MQKLSLPFVFGLKTFFFIRPSVFLACNTTVRCVEGWRVQRISIYIINDENMHISVLLKYYFCKINIFSSRKLFCFMFEENTLKIVKF